MEKPININEAVKKIKGAGADKVRAVPMAGQNVQTGLYEIQVLTPDGWTAIAEGMTQATANNIISQAVNKVICG